MENISDKIQTKKFILKSDAMTYEYELKHDKNKRLNIYNNSK